MIIFGFLGLFWLGALAGAPLNFDSLVHEISFGDSEGLSEYLNEVEKPFPPLTSQQYGKLFQALAEQKDLKLVQKLFELSILTNKELDQRQDSLLHYAAQEANTALAQWLIENGADRDARNIRNQAPRDYVSSKKAPELSELLTPKQELLDKIVATPSEFSQAAGSADINQGNPDATLLQIMLKKLFESRFENILADEDRENLASNILTLIDSNASLDPKILPKKLTDAFQSPLYYAALSDGDIFEKMIKNRPALLNVQLPTKNTILGLLVLEFLQHQQKGATEYASFLEDQIKYALNVGASLEEPIHGIKGFFGSIKEFVIARKDVYPELYRIFFADIVENLEEYAYSLEALRSAL